MPRRPVPASNRVGAAGAFVLAAFALAYALVALIRGVPTWVHLLYAGASLLCFMLYAIDKAAARAGRRRTPERRLLMLGLLGGWPGAALAQQLLRHKSSKPAFLWRFWGGVALHVGVFGLLAWPGSPLRAAW